MITQRRLRDKPAVDTARALAQLLRIARAHVSTSRAHVCPRCHHVFSRDSRLDMRCPGCADAAAEKESVRL